MYPFGDQFTGIEGSDPGSDLMQPGTGMARLPDASGIQMLKELAM
jgi:hypothetical protein